MSSARPAQPRLVAVAYGSLAMLLLIVVATVALVVQPATTPAVAEFAPSDPQRIESAPDNQDSRFGADGAAACVGGRCPPGGVPGRSGPQGTTSSTIRTIDRDRVRRCVGDPARQVEDPQSPPCVNYWDGDNGGASSIGVTGDEIRVGIRASDRVAEALARFFNRRFEFHGRTLRLVPLGATGDTTSPAAQRALAARAEELRVFATLGFDGQAYDTRSLATELARRGIVFVDRQSRLTAGELRAGAPHVWQYAPAVDDAHRAVVQLACASLTGRRAEYGGPAVAVRDRKFAVLSSADDGGHGPARELAEGLRRCQAGGPEVTVVELRRGASEDDYGGALTRVALDGVTTLLCVCYDGDRIAAMRAAQAGGYLPEWLLTGLVGGENPRLYVENVPAEQRAHVFGVASDNKFLRPVDEPWHFAIKEVDPSFVPGNLDRYGGHAYSTYQQLLLLASGIQLAGPRLTPTTFHVALRGARFPNPGAGSAPLWQAGVGFRSGDQTMVDDVTLVFWDEAANPGGATRGGFCYLDRGARYPVESGPRHAVRFFDRGPPCR